MNRAVLDFIGFPVSAPGNLECRLRRVTYRPDGSVLDDGSRTSNKQIGCHRLVLLPGQDIEHEIAQSFDRDVIAEKPRTRLQRLLRRKPQIEIVHQAGMLSSEGYAPPDTTLMHVVAEHEWAASVLTSRRQNSDTIKHRLAVRALGFDLIGEGQLSVGLSKVTSNPTGSQVTQKASVLLHPGDDLEGFIEATNEFAASIGYDPLNASDQSLLRHVAAHLWTPDRVHHRLFSVVGDHAESETGQRWLSLEFKQRVDDGVRNWWTVPEEKVTA